MPSPKTLTNLIELLHHALKVQSHYAPAHPQIVQSMEAVFKLLKDLLEELSPLILTFSHDRVQFEGRTVEGAPNAAQTLSKEMTARGIQGMAIHQGLDMDELQLLFFALLLKPHRLEEMGGPSCLLSEESNLRFIIEDRSASEAQLTPPMQEPLPKGPLSPILSRLKASSGQPQTSPVQVPVPKSKVAILSEADIDELWLFQNPAPTPAALANDLRNFFTTALQMTTASPLPSTRAPWSSEHWETMKKYGFRIPNFAGLVGTGTQLELDRIDPVTLRDSLRSGLSVLDPMAQGNIILGLPSFPSEEQALRRALDYLAPEFLAQAVAEVHIKNDPSHDELALLVAGLLTCVKDRELALEALQGRLQTKGWTVPTVNKLKQAILWECHGTDTKLQLSLKDRSFFDLDIQQVAILNRQLLKTNRTQGIKFFLDQVESDFLSPDINRRRHIAEILADLSECLDEPAFLPEMKQQLLRDLHGHLEMENDQQAMLWSCQAIEALLGHWIRKQQFKMVKQEMMALGELGFSQGKIPSWKAQAFRDLLLRLSSPVNMSFLTELLYSREDHTTGQIHALLPFMGMPAANHLVHCLEAEPDKQRRGRLLTAIRAIGKNAVPALKEALASPQWFVVRNAVQLLGEIQHKSVFEDVALAMGHWDPRVRKAAIGAVSLLGEKDRATEVICKTMVQSTINTQLDCLAALGALKSSVAVPIIVSMIKNTKETGEESFRLRLRAVETLGLIGTPDAIAPLRDLFKKKSILGGRESITIRISAAKSLAAINTRESREALVATLDSEPQEEVRIVLRKYLQGGMHN